MARHLRRMMTFYAGLLLTVLAMAGCGGDELKLVEAGGTVTYQGEPVSGASVVFISDVGARTAIGRTDDEGRFSLTTRGRLGAVVGSHKVGISALRLKREPQVHWTTAQILANEEWLMPKKYADAKNSGLEASVTEDPAQNQFEFEL